MKTGRDTQRHRCKRKSRSIGVLTTTSEESFSLDNTDVCSDCRHTICDIFHTIICLSLSLPLSLSLSLSSLSLSLSLCSHRPFVAFSLSFSLSLLSALLATLPKCLRLL